MKKVILNIEKQSFLKRMFEYSARSSLIFATIFSLAIYFNLSIYFFVLTLYFLLPLFRYITYGSYFLYHIEEDGDIVLIKYLHYFRDVTHKMPKKHIKIRKDNYSLSSYSIVLDLRLNPNKRIIVNDTSKLEDEVINKVFDYF